MSSSSFSPTSLSFPLTLLLCAFFDDVREILAEGSAIMRFILFCELYTGIIHLFFFPLPFFFLTLFLYAFSTTAVRSLSCSAKRLSSCSVTS